MQTIWSVTYMERLAEHNPVRWQGRVLELTGNLLESEGPAGTVGEAVRGDSRPPPATYTGERS